MQRRRFRKVKRDMSNPRNANASANANVANLNEGNRTVAAAVANDNDDDSSSSSSDSNISSYMELRNHQRRPQNQDVETSLNHSISSDANALPRLQDRSWIGARVSPIPPEMGHDDDENDIATAGIGVGIGASVQNNNNRRVGGKNEARVPPLHKAMHESSEPPFVFVTSERSSLLGQQMRRPQPIIRPIVEKAGAGTGTAIVQKRRVLVESWTEKVLGQVLVGTSGIVLACIGLHDGYLWYLQMRKGLSPKYSIMWQVPWLSPSNRALVRFGAFFPERMMARQQFWRCITSMFVCMSVLEWSVLIFCWVVLRTSVEGRRTGSPWASTVMSTLLYVTACGIGQFWMMCFHPLGIAGCALWGTGGLLCATGMARPKYRQVMFLSVIAIIVLGASQPAGSAYGAIGASFWGWSVQGAGILDGFLLGPTAINRRNAMADGASSTIEELIDGVSHETKRRRRIQRIVSRCFSACGMVCLWIAPAYYYRYYAEL